MLAVLSKIEHDLEDCSSDLSSKYDDAREQINNLGNDWEEFANAFAAAEEYRLMSNAYVEEVSQTIAYSMFRGSKSISEQHWPELQARDIPGKCRQQVPAPQRDSLHAHQDS